MDALTSLPDPAPRPPSLSETEMDRLFNFSLDLICIAGLDGYFRLVNPSWTRVLGWSREELLARPITDFMHPDDRESTLDARCGLARGMPVRGLENRYLCKDGSYRWLSWQSSIEPGADTIFAFARDVTQRRQADTERFVLGKIESTAVLAAGIAHDFNNLLAALLLNVEMAGIVGPLNPIQKQHLRQARDAVQAAKSLTQQLLVFADGGDPARAVTDLKALLRESLDAALDGSDLVGECVLAPDLRATAIDAAQIGQVIRNVVLNARESMPGGGTVRLRAENLTVVPASAFHLPAGDYLRISVSDEGAGMTPDTLARIFDPYFSTKQRGPQKGMGLGLAICHSILQKHGGAITVDSTPGRGTTVHCHLPAHPLPRPEALQSPHLDAAHPPRILVMDDEASVREIMSQTLLQLGYAVTLAHHGDEALALHDLARADGAPYAAVMLDLTVRDGMGGADALRALRARDPGLRAISMTGYAHEDQAQDPTGPGFDFALAKPFSMESLRAALDEVLSAPRPFPA